MKKLFYTILSLAVISCTDLDVPIESSYTSDVFPKTEAEFASVTGPVYVQMRNNIALDYYYLQELSTDEAVLTARGADYYDGGRYIQLNLHTWDETHPHIATTWTWAYRGVSLCGEILAALEPAPESETKERTLAEIRTMRALYYFFALDLFGNVPISPAYGNLELPSNSSSGEVYNFLVNEINDALPYLSKEIGTVTYGKPTFWMAHALLAKLHMSAEIYAGTPKYQEALESINLIMNATSNGGNRSFELEADFMGMFDVANGPQVREIIFAIPFDQNFGANGMRLGRFPLHPLSRVNYGLPTTISVGNCQHTWADFYYLFEEDLNDVRNQIWLAGPQFYNDGSPMMDGAYHVNHDPEIAFVNVETFDRGRSPQQIAQGARNVKYTPDGTWTSSRDSRNDFVLFRYADFVLLKAEAILRGAADPMGQSALELVNQVRSIRNASPYTSIDLSTLLDERGREMAGETWRRNDLIRFGTYESAWGRDAATGLPVKTNQETYRRFYPIPQGELATNPRLVQNPGYR
ncbi:RagB/SusD family nutrient uptake outer membrane protein [Belliella sp. DSM 111904]|uniref:RagB/SusD family nutrient uptake outer membrane protein n=1 Tax=Belliella filtrata TaxID=2923435 RepID=A0ABS9UYZ4_9BACT|nr:RagB/SusD family nutrient uptake outer membrane protein [Belliella filtrata]MCH7409170.1 RagB/SusD family nutrient uptake outer membrane protein [Belliella filtrata]